VRQPLRGDRAAGRAQERGAFHALAAAIDFLHQATSPPPTIRRCIARSPSTFVERLLDAEAAAISPAPPPRGRGPDLRRWPLREVLSGQALVQLAADSTPLVVRQIVEEVDRTDAAGGEEIALVRARRAV